EDFAPKTWSLRHISDMRTDQVLYTRRGWLVADLSNNVRYAKAVQDATIFSSMGKLPPQWRAKIERRVIAKRVSKDLRGGFLKQVFARFRRCQMWLQGSINF